MLCPWIGGKEKKTITDIATTRSDRSTNFGIHHFAGAVFYDTRGFIDKNKDSFSGDLLALMPSAKNKVKSLIYLLALLCLSNSAAAIALCGFFSHTRQLKQSMQLTQCDTVTQLTQLKATQHNSFFSLTVWNETMSSWLKLNQMKFFANKS